MLAFRAAGLGHAGDATLFGGGDTQILPPARAPQSQGQALAIRAQAGKALVSHNLRHTRRNSGVQGRRDIGIWQLPYCHSQSR